MSSRFTSTPVADVHPALSMTETELLDPFKIANLCTVEVPVGEEWKLFTLSSNEVKSGAGLLKVLADQAFRTFASPD